MRNGPNLLIYWEALRTLSFSPLQVEWIPVTPDWTNGHGHRVLQQSLPCRETVYTFRNCHVRSRTCMSPTHAAGSIHLSVGCHTYLCVDNVILRMWKPNDWILVGIPQHSNHLSLCSDRLCSSSNNLFWSSLGLFVDCYILPLDS